MTAPKVHQRMAAYMWHALTMEYDMAIKRMFWCMPHHGWTLKTRSGKEGSHQYHVGLTYFNEMPRVGESAETKRLVVVRG